MINKEIKSKTYTVTSYYFAKAFIEFSMAVIIGFIFCVTTYFWVNLNNDFSHFAIFCTAMTMVAFYTGAIALAVGSCVHNDRIALVVVIGINTGIYSRRIYSQLSNYLSMAQMVAIYLPKQICR